MSPLDAAKLLEVAPDATPETIESRFLELRAKLEDKIAKAPTPGLKEKYRATLTEITTAFETLAIAADSSSLPVLQRETPGQAAGVRPSAEARGQKPEVGSNPPPSALRPPSSAKRSGGKEFALVAIIAVIVLGAGGWFVMKTRAENAEKERVAAEAKAAAEQKAAQEKKQADDARVAKEAADKAEKDRQDRLVAQARTRLAELNVLYDAAMRAEQTADRKLADLQTQVRDLRGATTIDAKILNARLQGQQQLVAWIRDTLPTHPAKIAKAKAEQIVSAPVGGDVAAATEAYATAITQLQSDIATARRDLTAISARVQLTTRPGPATYTLTDVYGRTSKGSVPADLQDVPLGDVKLTFERPGWPSQNRMLVLGREGAAVEADFTGGPLEVASTPAGVPFTVTGQGRTERGTTPTRFAELPVGDYTVAVQNPGWEERKLPARIGRDTATPAKVDVVYNFASVTITTEPKTAKVTNGKAAGDSGYTFMVPAGEARFRVDAPGYASKDIAVSVRDGEKVSRQVELTNRPLDIALSQAVELLGSLDNKALEPLVQDYTNGNQRTRYSTHLGMVAQAVAASGNETDFLLVRDTTLRIGARLQLSISSVGGSAGTVTGAFDETYAGFAVSRIMQGKKPAIKIPASAPGADAAPPPAAPLTRAVDLIMAGSDPATGGFTAQFMMENARQIMSALVSRNRPELALTHFNRWKQTGPDANQYNLELFGLMDAFVANGKPEQAIAIFDENLATMVAKNPEITYFSPPYARAKGMIEIARYLGDARSVNLLADRVEKLRQNVPAGYIAKNSDVDDWSGLWVNTLRAAGRGPALDPWVEQRFRDTARMESSAQYDWRRALESYRLNRMIERGDKTGAIALLAAESFSSSFLRFTPVANGFARRADWDAAWEAFNRSLEPQYIPKTSQYLTASSLQGSIDSLRIGLAAIYGCAVAERMDAVAALPALQKVKDPMLRMLALSSYVIRAYELQAMTEEQRTYIRNLPLP